MNNLFRTALCAIFGLAVCIFAVDRVGAATFPQKQITIVVATPPGGTIDAVTRIIADKLKDRLGQPVIVQNKPGANSYIAARFVAQSEPDGYTLIMLADNTVIGPFVQKSFDLNLADDLDPIGSVCDTSSYIVTNNLGPFKTFSEFVAHAKSNPKKINFGSPILSLFDAIILFNKLGIDINPISYEGAAPSIAGLLANDIQLAISSLGPIRGQVTAGNIRPLIFFGRQRNSATPEVPTINEIYPEAGDLGGRLGLMAPKGVPADVVSKLNSEIAAVLKDPSVTDKLMNGFGFGITGDSPADWKNRLKETVEKYKRAAQLLKYEPQ